MSAETQQQQAGARAADASKDVPADGNGAPVPQVVSAPGIDASSPIVRTEVIPPGVVGGVGPAAAPIPVRAGKHAGGRLVAGGYVLAAVGFLVVCLVVPRIKSNVGGKALLLACVAVLAAGAGLVMLGLVRETIRRL